MPSIQEDRAERLQTTESQLTASQLTAAGVREEVAGFRERSAAGRVDADCFPAWYLQHRYRVATTDALAHTADAGGGTVRGYDFGLDAFHLLTDEAQGPVLVLVQAKFTDSVPAIAAGLRDLQRALPRVGEALTGQPAAALKENRVLVMLRSQLAGLDPDLRARLRLRFQVVHLSEADDLYLKANTKRPYDELLTAIENDPWLGDWLVDGVELVGPSAMGGVFRVIPRPPTLWHDVTLDAVPLVVDLDSRPVTMYSGIGRLADLVELYNQRRSELFAKNVRYFITSKANEERGPAGKIKETLRQTCLPKRGTRPVEPELFAFHHNGITIFARDVRRDATGRITAVREPYVLNGCQTVRSAYDFRYDARLHARIDPERWERVAVPIRIITSADEGLIRQVTISTNRQNQIAPSALRANDPVQIDLERRLRERGIFYERQRGAFAEIGRSDAVVLADYPHTNHRVVNIEDLARGIAASLGLFDLAHNPSHVFEYDTAYERVFAEPHLRSVTLLVLLQNLHDVLPVVLRTDLGLEALHPRGPRKTRLVYFTTCLLMRYLARQQKHEWVRQYGGSLLGQQKAFREDVARMLGNHRSRIQGALRTHFMALDSTTSDALRSAFQQAAWHANLTDDIDVFASLAQEIGR